MADDDSFGDLLADALGLPPAAFGAPTERPCSGGCGTTVIAPGAAWCDPCLAREEGREREAAERGELSRALESIPETWRGLRWTSFERLPVKPTSSLVIRVSGGREPIEHGAERYPWAGGVALIGPGGVGKTSLGCAMLHALITFSPLPLEQRKAMRFVSARMLPAMMGTREYAEAITAPAIVLDDVGAEGDMPSARSAVSNVLAERHAWNRRTIVTTWRTEAEIRAWYGDGIARRIFQIGSVLSWGAR